MYPKELIKLLEQQGFENIRQSGSHRTYAKGETKITVSINKREIKRGTLNSILKKAGLKE